MVQRSLSGSPWNPISQVGEEFLSMTSSPTCKDRGECRDVCLSDSTMALSKFREERSRYLPSRFRFCVTIFFLLVALDTVFPSIKANDTSQTLAIFTSVIFGGFIAGYRPAYFNDIAAIATGGLVLSSLGGVKSFKFAYASAIQTDRLGPTDFRKYGPNPFQGIETCFGADGSLASDCAPLNDNINLGCRGITDLKLLERDRTLARVSSLSVARGAFLAVAGSGFGSYMWNHREDSSWSFDRMSSWSGMATPEWWSFNVWFFIVFLVGVLVLIDFLAHVLPLMCCGFRHKRVCAANCKWRRISGKITLVMVCIGSIIAVVAIAFSIAFAFWLNSDLEGSKCTPHVFTSRVLYSGTPWNGENAHRFGGVSNLQANFEIYRNIENAVDALKQNADVGGNVLYRPLGLLSATQEFLGQVPLRRPAAGKEFGNLDGRAYGHHTIVDYDEAKWTFVNEDSIGGLKDEAAADISDALDFLPDALNRIQESVESATGSLINHFYPKLLEEFAGPVQSNWGQTTKGAFGGLLVFLFIPVVSWVVAIAYFVRHAANKEYMSTRPTGWDRRIGGVFVQAWCLWACVLWVVSAVALSWLYFPSEVCRWFQNDILKNGRVSDFSFLQANISQEYYDHCMSDAAGSSMLRQFDVPVDRLTETDIFNTSVPIEYVDQIRRSLEVFSFNVQGTAGVFDAGTTAEALHVSMIDHTMDDPWANVKSAWEAPFTATGDFANCPFNSFRVCLENIAPSDPHVACDMTILRSWVAAPDTDGVDSPVSIRGFDEILVDRTGAVIGYQTFIDWLSTCTQGDSQLERKLANHIYAGTLKSMIASNDNQVVSGFAPSRYCAGGCSLFSTAIMEGTNRGIVRDGESYENWVKDVHAVISIMAQDPATYTDFVNSLIITNGPIQWVRAVVNMVDTNFDCKEATAAVYKISDKLCSGVTGDMVIIAYCCLVLALLHTFAYLGLLRYWKADQLLDGKFGPPPISQDLFLLAAETGDIAKVKIGATYYEPSTVRDIFYQNTPLHLAAFYGHRECVAILLEQGYDPNALNAHSNTPLSAACQNKEVEWSSKKAIIRMLFAAGAELELYDYQGDTPLITATREQDENLVRLLLELGANPLIKRTMRNEDAVGVAQVKSNTQIQTLLRAASSRFKPGRAAYAISQKTTMGPRTRSSSEFSSIDRSYRGVNSGRKFGKNRTAL